MTGTHPGAEFVEPLDVDSSNAQSRHAEPLCTSNAGRQFTLDDGSPLPDAFAPFVHDSWYVIAIRAELGHQLRGITVLGEPLVYYRTEAGEAVVLDDRCAHRRYPLSKSHLIGDTIRCGYHGFTYDLSGRCIFAPGTKGPRSFGVRKYPAVERGLWLWVWMGAPEKADPALIPWPEENDPEGWGHYPFYTHNACNYMLLIENVLDLTHLHYLHGPLAADEIYANTPPKPLDVGPNGVGWQKVVEDTEMSLFAQWAGGNPSQRVRRVEEARQFGPNCLRIDTYNIAHEGDEEPVRPSYARSSHYWTPETLYSTHQFVSGTFNCGFVISLEEFVEFIHGNVFCQDQQAGVWIQDMILKKRRAQPECSIPSDRYGLKMRRILRRMASASEQ